MTEEFIDAAFAGEPGTNVAFFFLADQYVIYDYAAVPKDRVRDGVYPLSNFPPGNASGFPFSFSPTGSSTKLDTALRGKNPYHGNSYFFLGDKYMQFRWNLVPPAFDPIFKQELSLWNLPNTFSNLDASFNGGLNRDSYCYFFKGNKGSHPTSINLRI